jgi:hypothetical protein
MPQPTPGDAHVNGPLTNISVAWIQKSGFIAEKVFPTVPVQKQSDLYYEYSKDDFLRDEAKPRAPGTESAGGGFGLVTNPYSCLVEAFHKDVDDQLRANADSVLQLDSAATEFVTQKMMIRKEKRWMSKFFTTGVWGTDITPSTLWSAASSDPQKDVEVGKMAIQAVTGMKPNTLVLGARVLSGLRTNQAIRDQFKYTSADSIDVNMLAGLFDIDRILVAEAVLTSGAEGATGTTDFIAGKHALLCYSAPSPSLMQPTAGYTFAWSGFTGSIAGVRIKRIRMEHLESDRIEGQTAYDLKKVTGSLGYFFNGAVA